MNEVMNTLITAQDFRKALQEAGRAAQGSIYVLVTDSLSSLVQLAHSWADTMTPKTSMLAMRASGTAEDLKGLCMEVAVLSQAATSFTGMPTTDYENKLLEMCAERLRIYGAIGGENDEASVWAILFEVLRRRQARRSLDTE